VHAYVGHAQRDTHPAGTGSFEITTTDSTGEAATVGYPLTIQ